MGRDVGQDGEVELDQDHLRSILEAEHSYYSSAAPEFRDEVSPNPGARDIIGSLPGAWRPCSARRLVEPWAGSTMVRSVDACGYL